MKVRKVIARLILAGLALVSLSGISVKLAHADALQQGLNTAIQSQKTTAPINSSVDKDHRSGGTVASDALEVSNNSAASGTTNPINDELLEGDDEVKTFIHYRISEQPYEGNRQFSFIIDEIDGAATYALDASLMYHTESVSWALLYQQKHQ